MNKDPQKTWANLRTQFPLQHDQIYLNTSTIGITPRSVLDSIYSHMDRCEETGDVGHSTQLWQDVKSGIASLLNCNSSEIALTRNTTEGTNIICNGLSFNQRDEIITSTHEHVGNTLSWIIRSQRDKLQIRTFEPSTDDNETLQRITNLIGPRTRAISLPHVSCATGQILPVEAIGRLALKQNIFYFVDGAQAIGNIPVDVKAIGCHGYAASGHKWLCGPNGTGFLYVQKEKLDIVQARHVGAYSNAGEFSFTNNTASLIDSAQRYEYGTINTSLIYGLNSAISFWSKIGHTNAWKQNRSLTDFFRQGLFDVGAEILTPTDSTSIITFRFNNIHYLNLQQKLWEEHKIRLRGIYEGELNALRVSIHIYNSYDDIKKVIKALQSAIIEIRQ